MDKTNSRAIENMDVKEVRPNGATKAVNGKKMVAYFGDVKDELKKIEWTSKEELKAYTKIVLGSMFTFGIAIYIVDLLIRGSLNTIAFIIKAIAG